MWKLIISISVIYSSTFAKRAFADSSVPLSLFLNQSQTDLKRNHDLCFAYEDQTPGLPCNPAFLGFRHPSQFWIYGHGNNNLDYFQDVSDIVNGPVKADKLLPIVDHNSNEHFQLNSSLGYVTDTWGVSVIPSRLLLFTHIRNPALPQITVLAAREEEIQGQIGSFIDHNWSWGVQLRAIHRRFTYSSANFADHFTDDSDSLYQIKTEYSYYIEPSLLYSPEETEWNPILSLAITNLGKGDKNLDPYKYDPSIRFGLSISNALDYGDLRLGMTSQYLTINDADKLYSGVGIDYSLSYASVFTTVTELEKQFGINLNMTYFTSGITYAEQEWNSVFDETVNKIWRWDLGFKF